MANQFIHLYIHIYHMYIEKYVCTISSLDCCVYWPQHIWQWLGSPKQACWSPRARWSRPVPGEPTTPGSKWPAHIARQTNTQSDTRFRGKLFTLLNDLLAINIPACGPAASDVRTFEAQSCQNSSSKYICIGLIALCYCPVQVSLCLLC